MIKEELDILVEEWHTMDDAEYEAMGAPGLAEYLGWTSKEYARWLEHSVIPGD